MNVRKEVGFIGLRGASGMAICGRFVHAGPRRAGHLARWNKIRGLLANPCGAGIAADRYRGTMKTILAPLDFSSVSDAVVAQARELAFAVHARVVLLAVIQPPAITHDYAAVLVNIAEITAAGEKNAERQLTKLQSQLAAQGVAVETVQATGSPIPEIIEQAARFHADYIVMGSHGHTALYDLLVGSTTHGVLMRARCPVVIVPSAKQQKAAKTKPHRHAA
jgi:nucleotide-binding universal stress UspA family protein